MKNTTPEIQRCNLSSVVLQLTAININPLTFDFLDRPPTEVRPVKTRMADNSM